MNAKLNNSDTIFATVTMQTRTIVKLTLSGFNSMVDLMKSICNQLSGVAGLVTIELRNTDSGWCERKSLRLRRPEAIQLSLF